MLATLSQNTRSLLCSIYPELWNLNNQPLTAGHLPVISINVGTSPRPSMVDQHNVTLAINPHADEPFLIDHLSHLQAIVNGKVLFGKQVRGIENANEQSIEQVRQSLLRRTPWVINELAEAMKEAKLNNASFTWREPVPTNTEELSLFIMETHTIKHPEHRHWLYCQIKHDEEGKGRWDRFEVYDEMDTTGNTLTMQHIGKVLNHQENTDLHLSQYQRQLLSSDNPLTQSLHQHLKETVHWNRRLPHAPFTLCLPLDFSMLT